MTMRPRQPGDFHLDTDVDSAPLRSLNHAFTRIIDAAQNISDRRDIPGSMRLEILPTGIRIWYRCNEVKNMQIVSWKSIQMHNLNPLILAIDEVLKANAFSQSPEGRHAAKIVRKLRSPGQRGKNAREA
jgi:hypothetical protein